MKHKKQWLFILILLVCLALNHIFGWTTLFFEKGGLDYLRGIVDQNYLFAVVMYVMFTAIACVLLALPGITFAVVAGVMFGPWMGSILCLIGTTLGAVLSFIASRYFLKDSIRPFIMKNQHLRKLLFLEKPENEMIVLMITRLLPIFPFNLQNFAYGITNIGIVKYTVATFVFMTPGVVLFTLVTAGVIDEAARTTLFLIAIAICIVVIVASFYARRMYHKITTTIGEAL